MGLPHFPPSPIRLLPYATRAPVIRATGLSLALHGGIVALVVSGSGRWIAPQLASAPAATPLVLTVTFIASGPAGAGAIQPTSTQTHASHSTTQRLPPAPRFDFAALEDPLLAAESAPTLVLQEVEASPSWGLHDRSRAPAETAPVQSQGRQAIGQRAGFTPIGGGVTSVAELRGNPGDACPELRRPQAWNGSRDSLAVAVAFVVDTSGRIDQATLRVVQAPGRPSERTGFVPHIYTVSANVRIDRSLPVTAPEYGAIVARDVMTHVSGLRFRPGSRNGRPAQSMVLISCQVT